MALVKTKVTLDILKDLQAFNSKITKEVVATEIIDLIKDFTSKGISPIKGERKFVEYKNPDTYPGSRKNRVPVNLRLTGDMMGALDFWITSTSFFIGYKNKDDSYLKAEGHNVGTKTLPRRMFIPYENGSEFNETIMRRVRDIYSRIAADIIKKGNR